MKLDKSRILAAILSALMAVSAVACSVGESGIGRDTGTEGIPSDSSPSGNSSSSDSHDSSESESQSESESESESFGSIIPPTPDDVIVKESPAVADKYFDNALFIGDSLTTGFSLYSVLDTNFYANVGLSSLNFYNEAFITLNGENHTILAALEKEAASFKKIYVSMGINELYRTASAYKNAMSSILSDIRALAPNAVIYVQSVLPISKAVSDTKYAQYGGNEKIAAFNSALIELCRESGYYFLDVHSVMNDGNGALPADFTGVDGVHLKPDKYKAWADYIKTHAIITESSESNASNSFFSARLPVTPDAGESYISDIVFLGDSTTYMLMTSGYLPAATSNLQCWVPVSKTLTLAYVNMENTKVYYPDTGEELTVIDAVARKQPKILVITLGINGISFMNEEYFKSVYIELVNNVKRTSSNTTVILQSILPITKTYDTSVGISMQRINAANVWIEQIAEQCGVRYLHTIEALVDSEGYLPAKFDAGDGLHMMPDAYKILLEYIRVHAVEI